MIEIIKHIAAGLLGGIVVLLGFFAIPQDAPLGADEQTTITNPTYINSSGGEFDGSLKIGPNGSTVSELKLTSCDLSNANTSIAASSTGYVYCSVTGVASGDVVIAQLSTTTATTVFGGWSITSAKASTTAGMIDIRLKNDTGVAAVPSVGAVGSSTTIWYADN